MKKDNNHNSIIYGIRPLIEAIKSGKNINKIFIKKGNNNLRIKEILKLANFNKIPIYNVTINSFNKLKNKNHQGIFAYISPILFNNIELLLPSLYEQRINPLLLILDGITDIRNFGAILRTAVCMGVNAIIIKKKNSAAINDDVIKISSGAIFNIPICKELNLKKTILFLKESGIHIIATSNKCNKYLHKTNLTIPIAIILGNEKTGISKDCLNLSDTQLKIPIYGKIESFNVSISCSIILYEVIRQRYL